MYRLFFKVFNNSYELIKCIYVEKNINSKLVKLIKGVKMEDKEYIGEEYLKNILSNLSPKDVVGFAYKEWIPCQRSGYTILNIKTGIINGLGIELNQLPLIDTNYIELYSIESQEHPIKPENFFSEKEYEEYLEFKDDDPSEYTPDIVSEFCIKKDIDEDSRKIDILADRFEENEYFNYNKWESRILNEYYDMIQKSHSYYDTVDEEI